MFSTTAILERVRMFSALYLWQTKARAFSAFESKARAFSAFILARFGRSRLCLRLIHGSGVLGRFPCTRARVFSVLPPLFIRKESAPLSEDAHHGTRPFKRTTPIRVPRTARRRFASGPPQVCLRPTDPRCHRVRRHGFTCALAAARVPQSKLNALKALLADSTVNR